MNKFYNYIKKIKFNSSLLGAVLIGILSSILVVLVWAILFNPILHYLFSTEEEYMEDIIGMYESDAVEILAEKGFKTKITYLDYQEGIKPYTVFNMFPKPFTKIKKNRVIELSVFKNRSNIKVPNYIGLDIKEVRKKIKKDKLKLDDDNVVYYYDELGPLNKITNQKPAPGSKALEGSQLYLDICMGSSPNQFIIPDNIIGYGLDDVKIKLRKTGFSIGKIDTTYNNDYLEETVFGIYYDGNNDQKIEIYEGGIYTVPIRVNIIINKEKE